MVEVANYSKVRRIQTDAPTNAAYLVPIVSKTNPEISGVAHSFDVGHWTMLIFDKVGRTGASAHAATKLECEPSMSLLGIAAQRWTSHGICSAMKVIDDPIVLIEETPYSLDPFGATLSPRIDVEQADNQPAAFRAFKDLGAWLDAEDSEIADMVGVGRTTPYTWRRDNREPRAATAQRIYEHHATLDSLRRRLGRDQLRAWLHEGSPTRRERLLRGGLQSLGPEVHGVVFRPAARADLAAAPDVDTSAVMPAARPAQPSGRRPRRPPG
jgi:hypothetical protein